MSEATTRRRNILFECFVACPNCRPYIDDLISEAQSLKTAADQEEARRKFQTSLNRVTSHQFGLIDSRGRAQSWAVNLLREHVFTLSGLPHRKPISIDPGESSEPVHRIPGMVIYVVGKTIAFRIPGWESELRTFDSHGNLRPDTIHPDDIEDVSDQVGYTYYELDDLERRLKDAVAESMEYAHHRREELKKNGAHRTTVEDKEPFWLRILHCQLVHRVSVGEGGATKRRDCALYEAHPCGCPKSQEDIDPLLIAKNEKDKVRIIAESIGIPFPQSPRKSHTISR